MKNRISKIYILIIFTISAQQFALAQQVPLTQARLVVDSFSPQKDSIISIGVLIKLKEDWHIYWRNPGDSGLPTDINFTLPNEVVASEIKFPTPKIFYSDEIINYGYDNEVLFIAELTVPKNYSEQYLNITAKLTSLICKDLCRSFDTTLTTTINLSQDFYPDKNITDRFALIRSALPTIDNNIKVSAIKQSNSVSLLLDKSNPAEIKINSFQFYPYQESVFKNKLNHPINDLGKYLQIILEDDPFRIENPTEVKGIIILNDDKTKVYEINIPISY